MKAQRQRGALSKGGTEGQVWPELGVRQAAGRAPGQEAGHGGPVCSIMKPAHDLREHEGEMD